MIQTAILTPQGLQATPYQAGSLKEAEPYEPEGVYTVARTFQRDKALLLDAHLDRLEESARLENIPLQLDRKALRGALRQLIERSGNAESRFRITIPREHPEQIYLALEPLNPVPAEVRQKGVRVATSHLHRDNPVAKTTAWMSQRQAAFDQLNMPVYEVMLVNERGEILEGTTSNFYAVFNGELRTAGEGVLSGISRRALLQCIGDLLPLKLQAVTINDIPHLSETFLTSSSRGVIPIIDIDGAMIGDGQPGVITRELSRRYDAWTEAHLEPI
jgi:branched-chain amino acid aminotransferase